MNGKVQQSPPIEYLDGHASHAPLRGANAFFQVHTAFSPLRYNAWNNTPLSPDVRIAFFPLLTPDIDSENTLFLHITPHL